MRRGAIRSWLRRSGELGLINQLIDSLRINGLYKMMIESGFPGTAAILLLTPPGECDQNQ